MIRKTEWHCVKWMAVCAMGFVLAQSSPARADTYFQFVEAKFGIRLGTVEGTYDFGQEHTLIEFAWQQYLQQQKNKVPAVLFVGQAEIDGAYPSQVFLPPGTNTTLSFQFIDTTAGLPVAGPAVASVVYDANVDPKTPNVFVPIGTSTDAATHFSLSYTVSGEEPDIRATPYDSFGQPVFIDGVNGENVAVGSVVALVPEPSISLGLISGGAFLLKRRRPL